MIPRRPFYFLRHGESDWNVDGRWMGQRDRPLTARGRDQATLARTIIADVEFGIVFASPLIRAFDTAKIIVGDRKVDVVPEPGLMEVAFGVLEGCTKDDPRVLEWRAGTAFDGAEPLAEFNARVVATISRCLDAAKDQSMPVLFVAHAGIYHAIHDHFEIPAGVVQNCELIHFEPIAGTWRVTRVEPKR